MEHRIQIHNNIYCFYKTFHYVQELILGHVDAVTLREEIPFMGKFPKVQKWLTYTEETW